MKEYTNDVSNQDYNDGGIRILDIASVEDLIQFMKDGKAATDDFLKSELSAADFEDQYPVKAGLARDYISYAAKEVKMPDDVVGKAQFHNIFERVTNYSIINEATDGKFKIADANTSFDPMENPTWPSEHFARADIRWDSYFDANNKLKEDPVTNAQLGSYALYERADVYRSLVEPENIDKISDLVDNNQKIIDELKNKAESTQSSIENTDDNMNVHFNRAVLGLNVGDSGYFNNLSAASQMEDSYDAQPNRDQLVSTVKNAIEDDLIMSKVSIDNSPNDSVSNLTRL